MNFLTVVYDIYVFIRYSSVHVYQPVLRSIVFPSGNRLWSSSSVSSLEAVWLPENKLLAPSPVGYYSSATSLMVYELYVIHLVVTKEFFCFMILT